MAGDPGLPSSSRTSTKTSTVARAVRHPAKLSSRHFCVPDRSRSLRSSMPISFTVETDDSPECRVWQERATKLHWDTLEFFESYRHKIPGKDFGQRDFAVPVDDVDWSNYDIVISIDVSVPARVTSRFPQTVWAYYVREIKAPSYQESFDAPLAGQDLFLTQHFSPSPRPSASHCVNFPYHLQRVGGLAGLFGHPLPADTDRQGVFVDHHTMASLSHEERETLSRFAPVASTLHCGEREVIPTSERLAIRTIDADRRDVLLNAKFFLVTAGNRRVFGTSIVEAIAAGTLAIGTPSNTGCPFLFSPGTSAENVGEAVSWMEQLANDNDRYVAELERQRALIEYLCWARPVCDLKRACEHVLATRVATAAAGKQAGDLSTDSHSVTRVPS